MEKTDNSDKGLLLAMLTQISKQTKTVEADLLRKEYDAALNNMYRVNEKLEDYIKTFLILDHFENDLMEEIYDKQGN